MSQIFPRKANALARMSLAGAAGGAALLGLAAVFLMRSPWLTRQHDYIEQPVQFSHAHHVGGEGFDCRYCHTSVENSSFAGIPPTKTCMNCHSQLWTNAPILQPVRDSFKNNTNLTWIRVNTLPDFVYFNHEVHVSHGVGCVTCHGQVDKMPLMEQENSLLMEWCLDCHRAPEKYLRPKDQVFSVSYQPPSRLNGVKVNGFDDQIQLGLALKKEYNVPAIAHMTSCSVCHR